MLQWLQTITAHPLGAAVALAVGIAALLAGGYWLVQGSVALARRLGVSTLLIGLTVVAFGTSAPELAFNIIAAAGGHSELSFGNIVGSNIANIGLVLGITALISGLNVHSRVVTKELPWLIVVSLAMVALAWLPPGAGGARAFSRLDGVLMCAGFVVFMVVWKRMGQQDRADPLVRELGEEAEEDAGLALGSAIAFFVAGLVLLVAGGKLAEQGAVSIADSLGLSEALIGLTIVAVATSLPELTTGIIACRSGHPDLAVGNVVGSNIFNLLLVLGVTATVNPVAVPTWGFWDLIAMIVLTLLLLPIALTHRQKITRLEGLGLLALYAGYMTFTVLRELLWTS